MYNLTLHSILVVYSMVIVYYYTYSLHALCSTMCGARALADYAIVVEMVMVIKMILIHKGCTRSLEMNCYIHEGHEINSDK